MLPPPLAMVTIPLFNGLPFVSTAIGFFAAAVVLSIAASFTPLGQLKALLRLLATSLVAAAILTFAAGNYDRATHSPRATIVGIVKNLHRYTGKGSHSNLDVVPDDGSGPITFRIDYTGPNLHEGSSVSIVYLTWGNVPTRVTVLDSSGTATWSETEGDGTIGAIFCTVLGIVLLVSGFVTFRKYPDGNVPRRRRY